MAGGCVAINMQNGAICLPGSWFLLRNLAEAAAGGRAGVPKPAPRPFAPLSLPLALVVCVHEPLPRHKDPLVCCHSCTWISGSPRDFANSSLSLTPPVWAPTLCCWLGKQSRSPWDILGSPGPLSGLLRAILNSYLFHNNNNKNSHYKF